LATRTGFVTGLAAAWSFLSPAFFSFTEGLVSGALTWLVGSGLAALDSFGFAGDVTVCGRDIDAV
jgi:hypothetical protein